MRRLVFVLVLFAVLSSIAPAFGETELEAARREVTASIDRVDEAQVQADLATQAFDDAETREAEIGLRIEKLTVDVEALQQQFDGLQAQLSDFAIDRYIDGGIEQTSLIDEPDTSKAIRVDALAEVLTGENADLLDLFRAAQADLTNATDELMAEQEEQLRVIDELDAAQKRIFAELEIVQEELGKVQTVLDGLEEEERERLLQEARLREAAEAAARAEAARAAAEAEAQRKAAEEAKQAELAASQPAPGSTAVDDTVETPSRNTPTAPIATGDWICPVQGPVSFTDSWGNPRSGGRSHKGVDMMAADGTPVVAPVGGDVEVRGNSIGGLSFHLFGDDGNYYYGTHLSAYGNSGRVEAGTIVGYVGATGNASTPHLHFEIHIGGRGNATNPYPQTAAGCL